MSGIPSQNVQKGEFAVADNCRPSCGDPTTKTAQSSSVSDHETTTKLLENADENHSNNSSSHKTKNNMMNGFVSIHHDKSIIENGLLTHKTNNRVKVTNETADHVNSAISVLTPINIGSNNQHIGDQSTNDKSITTTTNNLKPSSVANALECSHLNSCVQKCSKADVLNDVTLDTEQKLGTLSLDDSESKQRTDEERTESSSKSQKISAPTSEISYVVYESERQMPDIMRLITKDLSEPYSIYTYRYFIHNWPKLCFLAMDGDITIGAIVCKLDLHKKMVRRGYIAMLAVDSNYRRRKIGSQLVLKAIKAMVADECDEVVLETEITNKAALHLYENLGFVRDKRLFRYYLNGVDALRLKLWLR
ncbi:uncharacterized protein LOC141908752 [Tubulanus polymorphus]|uniref:uncharacterized protein LOC141908752 n=1 Tax=Tubulanus polymorphus TaxID=672921 RepID=UPI003DA1EE18